LPFGIGLKSFPSAGFLITTFTAHLAVCGIMALASIQSDLFVQAIRAFCLFTLLALAAAFPLFPVTSAFLAAGSLWAVHQGLSQVEIN
jgi:hypothetical protein